MPPRKPKKLGRAAFGSVKSEGTPTTPSFSVRWQEGGKQRRKRGFGTRTEATAFLARVSVAMGDGTLDLCRKGQTTLASVAEEWLTAHSAVKLRSHQFNVDRWKRLIAFFGPTLSIGDIGARRIMELRAHLHTKEGLAPASVNRYLALLRTILNHAVTAGYLEASPVRRFPRGGYLLAEGGTKMVAPLANLREAADLLQEIRNVAPQWFAIVAFLLHTGARRGEAAGLYWQDVDTARRLVTIRRSYELPPKSGKARTVPLTTEVCAILEEHRRQHPALSGAHVFLNPATGRPLTKWGWDLNAIVRKACDAAGVAPIRVHDLRHAHAGLWLMAGGSIADVQRNLGHSSPLLTVNVYGHLGEDHRIAESDKRLSINLKRPR